MPVKKLSVKIEDGDAFFAHETSINFSPTQIVLDFKNITPRMDPRAGADPILVLKHNPIILSPDHAKNLAELLNKIIKRYEKEFGKIKKPAALEKYEKKHKKKSKQTKIKTPEYFG